MQSIFTVTDPNAGLLLTTAEAKAALGVSGSSRDTDIANLVSRISASIFRACNLRTDGVNPPTLLSEGISESIRFNGSYTPLLLSRRRITEIGSVTESGTELESTGYEYDAASGLLMRLDTSDTFTTWPAGRVVVEYTAGLETVPADLKLAAEMWLRSLWRDNYASPETLSDPLIKVEDIPGVRRIERWVEGMTASSADASLVPPEVKSILVLGGYVEIWVA